MNGQLFNNDDTIFHHDIHDDDGTILCTNRPNPCDNIPSCKKESLYENDNEYDLCINPIIFRYKFTQECMDAIYHFSKIHQYDDRNTFKEAWDLWAKENDELISKEINRLEDEHYRGNILEKMYKSARYYFRKKSTKKNAPKERKNYVSVQKTIIDAMDTHIYENIQDEKFKPSSAFVDFCIEHNNLLKEEVTHLMKHGFTDSNEIRCKIKKTYKNRYFLIISKK
jgi:hypothetical protein